tara:strand:+ start:5414 stop:5623 length:210 start_codon:yes stop_codon:yes gene_type:complete
MCTSTPDIPDPVPPPAPPPPPTNMAKSVKNKAAQNRRKRGTTTGVSSLTIRRPSVNVGTQGTGANVSYS